MSLPRSPSFLILSAAMFAPAAFVAPDLSGTWTLVSADVIRADGTRGHDYGEAPIGRLHIDTNGRYALQILDSHRPRFASGDKKTGTADEFKAAVMGASTHFGTIEIGDEVLRFHIEGSSFPNWEGQTQERAFTLDGDVLSYRVPPRPDGGVPVSTWRRLD